MPGAVLVSEKGRPPTLEDVRVRELASQGGSSPSLPLADSGSLPYPCSSVHLVQPSLCTRITLSSRETAGSRGGW